MSEEIQNTSEVGAEKWDCTEACECIQRIADRSWKIHELIERMDSTFGMSDGIFWIRTSQLFALSGERGRVEIRKEVDRVCLMWFDVIRELIARKDESVLFVPVQANKLTIEDRDAIISIWIQFFRNVVIEGRCKNRRGKTLRIEINYLEKWVFSIILYRL